MDRFGLSWVSLCRLFRLASMVDYSEIPESTFKYLFSQCSAEEKQRLYELFPELIEKLKITKLNKTITVKF